MSRYPLEGYRERCDTDVVLGDRNAKYPLHLDIPVTIAGMSFGALSAQAKEALGRGASEVGTSTTTGDGGMTPEERGQSKYLVYQYLPSRYGMNPDDLRKADAIEIVLGQGAKPGGGGMLLGQKISERVAGMRTLPAGIDQRSACRHPDWTGPDDLAIKIHELREITDWEKPIYVKVGATRTYYDVKLAVAAGADVVVVDGMQGGTAATQEVFIEHVGIPTLAAIPQAVQALRELGVAPQGPADRVRRHPHRRRRRQGAWRWAPTRSPIGTAALIALGDNHPRYAAEYEKLGSAAGFYDDYQDGRDPAGITTQDPDAGRAARPRRGRPADRQLPARAHHGGADHRPRLRQGPRAPPRARGPGRAHHRGGRHGPGAAGRHRPGFPGCRDEQRPPTSSSSVAALQGAAAAWALARRGVTDVVLCERDTVGSGGTGKSSGVVRCHYGVSSLAAMATTALEVFENAEEIFGHRHRLPPDRLRRRRRRTQRRRAAREPGRPARRRRPHRGDRPRRSRQTVANRGPGRLRRLRVGAPRRLRRRLLRPPRPSPPPRASTVSAIRQGTKATEIVVERRTRSPGPAGRRLGDRGHDRRRRGRPVVGAAAAPHTASTCRSPVHREQIVLVDPGVSLGPVPVFSDLVSLQYVRPEVQERSCSATATCDPAPRRPRPVRQPGRHRLPRARRRQDGAPVPRPERGRHHQLLRRLLRRHPRLQPGDLAKPRSPGSSSPPGSAGTGSRSRHRSAELIADLVVDGSSSDPDIPRIGLPAVPLRRRRPAAQPPPIRGRGRDALTPGAPILAGTLLGMGGPT